VPTLYLDASALVKLVRIEAETPALRETVRMPDVRAASSVIAVAEVGRAARRMGRSPDEALGGVVLMDVSDAILQRAAVIDPPSLRTLDAIHLATALTLGDDLDGFVAYDRRLEEAATAAGLRVLSPA